MAPATAPAGFDALAAQLDEVADPGGRADFLIAAIAERMAATSNDQNVQRLARALRAAAPSLSAALIGGARR